MSHPPGASASDAPTPDRTDRAAPALGADERLALAAHDVNNALNTILVCTHLLQLTASDPDAVRRHADRIASAARQGVAAATRVSTIARGD